MGKEIITAVKGIKDVFGHDAKSMSALEAILRKLAQSYAYNEIKLPILEKTSLYLRGVGEVTDIVQKEMYSFDDLNGEKLSLRPEGTAGCVRAVLEHNLLYAGSQKLWYMGPMFRRERPQKGRYRQFNQFGVEFLGLDSVLAEAEMLNFCYKLLSELKLDAKLHLQINSLGSKQCRARYKTKLLEFLQQNIAELDEDSKGRLASNPLRILDSKVAKTQQLLTKAPRLQDSLSQEAQARFASLLTLLEQLKIPYSVNHNLVRGLDYYEHTVFEWVTDTLGAQGTVIAGGKYDGLFAQLGGKTNVGIGFALGLERLHSLWQGYDSSSAVPDIYLISTAGHEATALNIADSLRAYNYQIATDGIGSIKAQIKRADRSEASLALILGDTEVEANQICLKYLREDKEQLLLSLAELPAHLASALK